MAVVSEHLDELPGVDVTSDWERSYPYKSLIRTLLGSVSSSNEGLPSNLLDHYLSLGYSRNDRVGKSYLEYQYESLFAGSKRESAELNRLIRKCHGRQSDFKRTGRQRPCFIH
ncbi:hypothetical protein QNN00_12145 [Bacillus velezensis]|nr:hypothetical protein [Bacillus velezensis]